MVKMNFQIFHEKVLKDSIIVCDIDLIFDIVPVPYSISILFETLKLFPVWQSLTFPSQ